MLLDESDSYIPAYVRPAPQETTDLREPPPAVARARAHADAAFHAAWSYADEKTIVRDRPVEEVRYFTYSRAELAASMKAGNRCSRRLCAGCRRERQSRSFSRGTR
jgi:hypothetical protein